MAAKKKNGNGNGVQAFADDATKNQPSRTTKRGTSAAKKSSEPSKAEREREAREAAHNKMLDRLFELAENEDLSWEDIAATLNKEKFSPPRGDEFTGSKVSYLYNANKDS